MGILRNIAHALGAGQDDRESDRQPYYVDEDTGRGYHLGSDPSRNYHEYNDYGITDNQQRVLEMWIIHGQKQGAHFLGMNLETFKDTVAAAKSNLGIDYMSRTEAYAWFVENMGYNAGEGGADDDTPFDIGAHYT